MWNVSIKVEGSASIGLVYLILQYPFDLPLSVWEEIHLYISPIYEYEILIPHNDNGNRETKWSVDFEMSVVIDGCGLSES